MPIPLYSALVLALHLSPQLAFVGRSRVCLAREMTSRLCYILASLELTYFCLSSLPGLLLGEDWQVKTPFHPVVDVCINKALILNSMRLVRRLNGVPLVNQAPDLYVFQHPLWKAPNLICLWVIIRYVKQVGKLLVENKISCKTLSQSGAFQHLTHDPGEKRQCYHFLRMKCLTLVVVLCMAYTRLCPTPITRWDLIEFNWALVILIEAIGCGWFSSIYNVYTAKIF